MPRMQTQIELSLTEEKNRGANFSKGARAEYYINIIRGSKAKFIIPQPLVCFLPQETAMVRMVRSVTLSISDVLI